MSSRCPQSCPHPPCQCGAPTQCSQGPSVSHPRALQAWGANVLNICPQHVVFMTRPQALLSGPSTTFSASSLLFLKWHHSLPSSPCAHPSLLLVSLPLLTLSLGLQGQLLTAPSTGTISCRKPSCCPGGELSSSLAVHRAACPEWEPDSLTYVHFPS